MFAGGVAHADPASAGDPIHRFAAQFPKLKATLAARKLDPILGTLAPCVDDDGIPSKAPAIDDTTAASTSPDGATLVVIATLDLDRVKATALGIPWHADDVAGEVFALVLNGPSGSVWGGSLAQFMACNPNHHTFDWTADSHRVHVSVDTGHGERVALIDPTGPTHGVKFTGFLGLDLESPAMQHIAWMPWSSGFPAGSETAAGDELWIDDQKVWGSSDVGVQISGVAWTSETVLTFCGQGPKSTAASYSATVRAKSVVVKRTATTCKPDE
jgi:hypothetical protein